MANNDAIRALAQQTVKLGLVTAPAMQDALDELGPGTDEPQELIRILERRGFLTPYQSGKLLKGDTDGYFLGGYRLLYRISSGSFGRVYRADDPSTGRVVAIKVLRRRWSEDPHAIELFEREGKLGLALRHPNIVEILNVNQDPVTRQYYIVMEFVEGGNLRELLQTRKKFEPRDALRIIEEAAVALTYAYSRGVTHRDMKLTNVLISSQGEAKLVDFGLAGIFTTVGQRTDEQVDRTVDYAGLEKSTGVKTGDVRSDIYFLGCVLYEMLTGRSPLVMSRDRHARMQAHRFSEVKPMQPGEVNGPPSLYYLVERMMALNPLQRYQTPSQLLEAVREARREVESGQPTDKKEGSSRVNSSAMRSVFVVERDERLQDTIRQKLKGLGYRVFIAAQAERALDRFRQQPFDGLILDVGTAGQESFHSFEAVLREADRRSLNCAGILILDPEQADLAKKLPNRQATVALVRPITLKQLHSKLQELIPVARS
jgi:serine/threonine protein kinase